MEFEKEQKSPALVCIDSAKVPIEGIFPARSLTWVGTHRCESLQAASRAEHAVTGLSNACVYVSFTNFSGENPTLPKSTVFGVAEEVSEQIVDRINPGNQTDSNNPTSPPIQKKSEALYNKLLHDKIDHLSQEDWLYIEPMLRKYAHVFHKEKSNDFKGTDVIEYQIDVGDARPIRCPQYIVPNALREEIQSQKQNMLKQEIIRESIALGSSGRFGPQKNN
jgi:hypothetical protein